MVTILARPFKLHASGKSLTSLGPLELENYPVQMTGDSWWLMDQEQQGGSPA